MFRWLRKLNVVPQLAPVRSDSTSISSHSLSGRGKPSFICDAATNQSLEGGLLFHRLILRLLEPYIDGATLQTLSAPKLEVPTNAVRIFVACIFITSLFSSHMFVVGGFGRPQVAKLTNWNRVLALLQRFFGVSVSSDEKALLLASGLLYLLRQVVIHRAPTVPPPCLAQTPPLLLAC